jgi:hypothetical protein
MHSGSMGRLLLDNCWKQAFSLTNELQSKLEGFRYDCRGIERLLKAGSIPCYSVLAKINSLFRKKNSLIDFAQSERYLAHNQPDNG